MAGIREARQEDFERLWQIDQQCFAPEISYTRGELAVYMRRRGAFTLVAEEDGRVIGFLVAAHEGRRKGHIVTIDVLPEHRRARIGSRLLEEAEQRLRADGCYAVTLETAVDNGDAISFYKRHGFSVVGTIPRYYANSVDALVMQKGLE